jgi:ABC-type branched-subunit amino acid transport system ATPase component
MSDYAKAVVTDLPYGLQRKVEIARALASRPDILLLDEPVAGMSQGEREALSALIKQLSEQGLTQVLVEHDVGMVTSLCPRVVVLDQGRVIAEGPPRTVMQTPQVRDAYLGGDYAEA